MDYEFEGKPRTRKDKEHFKIYERVFNNYTMRNLNFLVNRGLFRTLDYPISTGKEADVYRGTDSGKKNVAIKIYRVETSDFKKMSEYIDGDPRFRNVRHSKNALVNEWCKKEHRNLSDAHSVGIRVPEPYGFRNNVLVMEFIGEGGKASEMLKDSEVNDAEKVIEEVLFFVRRLYSKGLVHADLSAFNILMRGEKPHLIDMGQAVSVKHPRAYEFLRRDLYNLEKVAKKLGVKIDHSKIYQDMVK